MTDREMLCRFGAVALIVGGVLLAATLAGKSDFAFPLSALAWWGSLLLVIRPYAYERHGRKTGDWIMVIRILGPVALLVAPFSGGNIEVWNPTPSDARRALSRILRLTH